MHPPKIKILEKSKEFKITHLFTHGFCGLLAIIIFFSLPAFPSWFHRRLYCNPRALFCINFSDKAPKTHGAESNKTELGKQSWLGTKCDKLWRRECFNIWSGAGFLWTTFSLLNSIIFFSSTFRTQVKLCFISDYNKHSQFTVTKT